MTIGIYKLEYTDGSVYIGSSVNVEERYKTHCYSMVANKHPNHKIQRAYNQHGLPKLVLITECLPEDLSFLEESSIAEYDAVESGLNLSYNSINRNRGCSVNWNRPDHVVVPLEYFHKFSTPQTAILAAYYDQMTVLNKNYEKESASVLSGVFNFSIRSVKNYNKEIFSTTTPFP